MKSKRGVSEAAGRLTSGIWIFCCVFFMTSVFIAYVNTSRYVGKYMQQRSDNISMSARWSNEKSGVRLIPMLPSWNNLLVEKSSNYTHALSRALELNASGLSPCYSENTTSAGFVGLPEPVNGKIMFTTDAVHQLTLRSYSADGRPRCSGGDYYEVDFHDLANVSYRSRLPTVDFGNGSYGLELIVPSGFAGSFSVDIWLLFSNWHGMDHSPAEWVRQELMVTQEVELIVQEVAAPNLIESNELATEAISESRIKHPAPKNLKRCTPADFSRTTWQGRWTRSWYNENCEADSEKRFRCLPEEHYMCEESAGWCEGPLGRLESNGWQYSAHCSFKIFEREEAWDCVNGRWFLMWGDSNFQDTVRNLLLFILEWKLPHEIPLSNFQLERSFDTGFMNPNKLDQMLRVSQIFNGGTYYWDNGKGLNTLKDEGHQQIVLDHFKGETWPDTIIMNSGLHDGEHFVSVENYAELAEYTVQWWTKLYLSIEANRRPQLVWRSTVAPAGLSRKMKSNPNKMEMFNQVMVEKLQLAQHELPVKFVDAFDLTFPFHYTNEFSDGGHYGRAPGVWLTPWFGEPHWYFVDIFLGHILLNAVCPSK